MKKPQATKTLQHLIDFVFGSPDEVASMTPAEVHAALIEEGIDIDAAREKMQRRLAEIRGENNPRQEGHWHDVIEQ